MKASQPLVWKGIVLGDAAVGKTTLVGSLACGAEVISSSQFVSCGSCTYQNQSYELQLRDALLDIEDCSAVFSEIDVAILCYSIISPVSYDSVKRWQEFVVANSPQPLPCVLVGTKADLRNKTEIVERLVERSLAPLTVREGKKLAKAIGAVHFAEVISAVQEEGSCSPRNALLAGFQKTLKVVHKKKLLRHRLCDNKTNCTVS